MAETYLIPGKTDDVALVVAGVHGTEFSGVEVVRWLWRKLLRRIDQDAADLPLYTTVIIPNLFPGSTQLARQCQAPARGQSGELKQQCQASGGGREVPVRLGAKGKFLAVPPNRQFPPPGKSLRFLLQHKGPTDPAGAKRITRDANGDDVRGGIPLLGGTVYLLQVIERFKPKRIATVHSHSLQPDAYGVDAPGIFVDPRYIYAMNSKQCQVLGADGRYSIFPLNIPLDVRDHEENVFRTDICKFDLGVEPAAPVIGLILELNSWMAGWTAPSQTERASLKSAVDAAAVQFRTESRGDQKRRSNLLHTDSFRLAKAAEAQAGQYGFGRRPLDWRSAKTPEGKQDDDLTIAIAKKIEALGGADLLPGNHLKLPPGRTAAVPVVHYAASAGSPLGFSLGDWGPVAVNEKNDPGNRPGAPVVTVEVSRGNGSRAFADDGTRRVEENCKTASGSEYVQLATKVDRTRCAELQKYAEALISIFLNT